MPVTAMTRFQPRYNSAAIFIVTIYQYLMTAVRAIEHVELSIGGLFIDRSLSAQLLTRDPSRPLSVSVTVIDLL